MLFFMRLTAIFLVSLADHFAESVRPSIHDDVGTAVRPSAVIASVERELPSTCSPCLNSLDCAGGEVCQEIISGRILSLKTGAQCKHGGLCGCIRRSLVTRDDGSECGCSDCRCKVGCTDHKALTASYTDTKGRTCGGTKIKEWKGGESWQSADSQYGAGLADLSVCKAICAIHPECAGFDVRRSNGQCDLWQQSPMKLIADADSQCYLRQTEAELAKAKATTAAVAAAAAKSKSQPKKKSEPPGDIMNGGKAGVGSKEVNTMVMLFYFFVPTVQVLLATTLIILGEWKRRDKSIALNESLARSKASSQKGSIMSDRDNSELESERLEESMDYIPQGPQKVEIDYHGAAMRFPNTKLEAAYFDFAMIKGVTMGSKLLFLCGILFLLDNVHQSFQDFRCERPVDYHTPELVMIGVLMLVSLGMTQAPKKELYGGVMCFLFLYILFRSMPPFMKSCDDFQKMVSCAIDWSLEERIRVNDCALLGHTSQEGILYWVLLTPWTIPFLFVMHGLWAWALVVYPAFALMDKEFNDHSHTWWERVMGILVVCSALLLSTAKKSNVEKAQRLGYVADLEQKKASYKMYTIFQYMVPVHVIPKMIQTPGEPIGDHVECVSILFVSICDFDKYSTSLSAASLIQFLNQVFGHMDRICASHKVTKVETVADEYVACVGTVPEDVDITEKAGHQKILARLVRAAAEILELQNEDWAREKGVRFQMGMHTGPIVAGVIGSKLPRYRLFGDTINTTARFMQKGEPGKLQFSDETKKELPDSIEVVDRGEVEMKGKGKVQAWFLKTSSEVSAAGPELGPEPSISTDSRKKGIAAMLSSADDKEVEGDEEYDDSFVEVLNQMELRESEEGDFGKKFIMTMMPNYTHLSKKMEVDWFMWFHKSLILPDLFYRLDKQACVLACLTLLEVGYLQYQKAWDYDHNIFPGWLRIPMFQSCRTVAFLILMFWRMAAHSSRWVGSHPHAMQTGLVLSYCFIAVLLYVSYDIMILSTHEDLRHARGGSDEDDDFRMDQFLSLIFVLEFNALSTWDSSLFSLSWAWILVAAMLMELTRSKYGALYFHTAGRVLFVCMSMMVSYISYEVEQSSKARFKSRAIVELAEKRVGGILKTLMPPQVLEELRVMAPDAPLPSHLYRAATISQSDLCGFTELSAGRRPEEVVQFISDLFGRFDNLCEEWGIYKVETVGDAYIAGMAEHTLTKTNSTISVIRFSFACIEACSEWCAGLKQTLGIDKIVTCRVGVHFGECVGGIVGSGMQRYHLFGALMQQIEILESCGAKGQVQVSGACKNAAQFDRGPEGTEDAGGGLIFTEREEEFLETSKGHRHDYSEVGGKTFLVTQGKRPDSDAKVSQAAHAPAA